MPEQISASYVVRRCEGDHTVTPQHTHRLSPSATFTSVGAGVRSREAVVAFVFAHRSLLTGSCEDRRSDVVSKR